jgi:hypothetical protein
MDDTATPSVHLHMVRGPNDETCVTALTWSYAAMRPMMQPCKTAPPETWRGALRAFPRDLVGRPIDKEGCVIDICQTRPYRQSTRQSRVSIYATPCSVIRPCRAATQVIDACATAESWKIDLTWSQPMLDTTSSLIQYVVAKKCSLGSREMLTGYSPSSVGFSDTRVERLRASRLSMSARTTRGRTWSSSPTC